MYFENQSTNLLYDISGIGIDNTNQVYVSGFYEESVIVHDAGNNTSFTLEGRNSRIRSYLLKFDANGHFIWKTNLATDDIYGNASISDVATDVNGISYITGSSSSKINIINANESINSAAGNYFLMKIDSSGLYKWSTGSKSKYNDGGEFLFY